MRILLTIGDISITGGAERVVVNLAHAFMQNGYDVELLSFFQANAMLPYEIDSRIPLHIWQTEAESVFNKRMCANIIGAILSFTLSLSSPHASNLYGSNTIGISK